MHKILIVLKSEFMRRVRSKWFIVATLLAPILLIGISVIPALVGIYASKTDQKTVAIIDETGKLGDLITAASDEQLTLVASSNPEDSLRSGTLSGAYSGYLIIPPDVLSGQGRITYFSSEGGGLSLPSRLERIIENAIQEKRLTDQNVSSEVRSIFSTRIDVETMKLTDTGETAGNSAFYSILGYIMGFFIYALMFIYGAQVMQGAMEEKSTRVVEIVVSSVRPFDLLMGKVLGIGAVGLVQMAIWILLFVGAAALSGSIVTLFVNPADFNLPDAASQAQVLEAMNFSIPAISPMVFVWFLLFFLGGYLLYSSLFAAVGSAVDQQQDAQGLMMPITMLIIIPILFMTFVVESPDSTFSTVLSMIPFFSPILMVVRVAVTDVPFWQVGSAFVLLILTFVGAIWLSARIYRVGILMYGKKPSIKDLAKWVRYA